MNMNNILKIINNLSSGIILNNNDKIATKMLKIIKVRKDFLPAFSSSLVLLATIIPVGIANKTTTIHNNHCQINIKKNINLNL